MSLEAVRIVADSISSQLAAFNALVAGVPRATGEDAPGAVLAVYDRTRHGWVARNEAPRAALSIALPALVVTIPEPDDTEPSSRRVPEGARIAYGTVSVAVQYLAYSASTEVALAASSRTLRAVRGWLIALAESNIANRTLHGVQLVDLQRLRQVELYDPRLSSISSEDRQHVDGVVLGGVIATWKTREALPSVDVYA